MCDYFQNGCQIPEDVSRTMRELSFKDGYKERVNLNVKATNIAKTHKNSKLSPLKTSKKHEKEDKKLSVAEKRKHVERAAEKFLSKYVGEPSIDKSDVKILTPQIANIMYFQRNSGQYHFNSVIKFAYICGFACLCVAKLIV